MVLLVQPKQKDDGFRIDLEAEVANVAETNYLRLYFDSSIGSSGSIGLRLRWLPLPCGVRKKVTCVQDLD